MRWPVRLRLALAFAGVMAVLLGAAGTFLYVRLSSELRSSIDAGLRAEVLAVASGIGQHGIAFGDSAAPIGASPTVVQLLSPNGHVLERQGSSGPLVSPSDLGTHRDLVPFDAPVAGLARHARVVVHPLLDEGQRVIVAAAASLEPQRATAARLLVLLAVVGPLALALATLGGWVLAGAALRPVERMRRDAASISVSDTRRLRIPGTDDEIGKLGTTLNSMLDRLRSGYERERRFVADASHELRTPLAILKSELELGRSSARTEPELRAALDSAAEETDRLVALAEDLLLMSSLDGAEVPIHREPTDIRDLLERSVEPYRRAARASLVAIGVEAPAVPAVVDPARLRRSVENLVRNSLRFVDRGGFVDVTGVVTSEVLRITVEDSGPGFPPDVLPRAFEPFTRGRRQRGASPPGAGLGLAIVRAVVSAHGGTVKVGRGARGGALVTIEIPMGVQTRGAGPRTRRVEQARSPA